MLTIQCPSCTTRFNVEEDYIGRFVECSSCQDQFVIGQEHVINERKATHHPVFRNSDLSGFSKKIEAAPVSKRPFTKVKHAPKLPELDYMPIAPWKRAMQLIGLTFVCLGAILLLVGSMKNNFLTDVALNKRLVFAGGFSVISIICFCTSFRLKRSALFASILSVLVLISLAYVLPQHTTPVSNGRTSTEVNTSSTETKSITFKPDIGIDELKKICQYQPVERAIQVAKENGDSSGESIVAVWIHGDIAEYQYVIASYFQRSLGLDLRPDYYLRSEGGLVVIKNLDKITIQDVAKAALIFGALNDIHTGSRLVSVSFNHTFFKTLNADTMEVLKDDNKEMFYSLNIKELSHFDGGRIIAAVKRLKQAEQLRYKHDVVQMLITVLSKYRDPEMTRVTSDCLERWVESSTEFKEKILEAAKIEQRGSDAKLWPRSLVRLLLKLNITEVEPYLIQFWNENPVQWESVIINANMSYAKQLTPYLSESDKTKNLSIIHIIANDTPEVALPLLQQARRQLGDEYDVTIDKAIYRLQQN